MLFFGYSEGMNREWIECNGRHILVVLSNLSKIAID